MWQKYILLTLLSCLVHSQEDIQKSYYTIVGSQQIRPNSVYATSVSLHEHSVPCQILLSIENDSNKYKKSEIVSAIPGQTQVVEIATGDMLSTGNYKLIAEGIQGFIFKNETTINLNEKRFSVFIQTDKGMYKPGDLVRFRVLVLNENTKPAVIRGDLNVFITDGSSNRIKQWNAVKTIKGVFSNKLQLSEYPVLGNWNINVEVMGEIHKKLIEVAEYVLPKFEAIIDGPSRQLWADGVVRVKVSGKYTYGQPVRGKATVSINDRWRYYRPGEEKKPLLQKVVPVEDSTIVEFKIDDFVKDTYRWQRDYEITLVLEEALTGKTQTTTLTVSLIVNKYNIQNVSPSSTYKPGLPFDVSIKITKFDDTPIIADDDDDATVKVNLGPNWNNPNETIMYLQLDRSGLVSFSLTIPDKQTALYIGAEYSGQQSSIGYFSAASSLTGAYLQASVISGTPTFNKHVRIEIESTHNIKSFTYQVLGRGNVLLSKTIHVSNRKKHTFSFRTTFDMVPKAQVIIYYLNDGEIISTQLELKFGDELENKITIKSSVREAKPGAPINITVRTTARDSFVGLLGVDQSVLILKPGFDIAYSSVFDDLNQYNQRYYPPFFGPIRPMIQPILVRPAVVQPAVIQPAVLQPAVVEPLVAVAAVENPPPVTVSRRRRSIAPWYWPVNPWPDFNTAGAVIMSNTKYREIIYNRFPMLMSASAGVGMAAGLKAGPPSSESTAPAPIVATVRKDFPETWLWDEFENFSGSKVLNKAVPSTITSWIITGLSVSPNIGLGLTKDATKLRVFQPFFVSLDLPYSIKRGETVAIKVIVFNYMSSEVKADVTLFNEKNEFEFAEPSTVTDTAGENIRKKAVLIKASDGTGLTFLIRSKIVGPLTIKVGAITDVAGDAMERILPVEPEGTPQFINQALFIDLREQSSYQASLSVAIPSVAVPDSTRVEVSIIGDILGVTLKNLESLIRMPSGCGEQNMVGFVPNIVAIDYLTNTNQLTPETEAKAKNYMESGYQRQLSYAHPDGSFSAFGKSDNSGSTWLTAYVVRSFIQASKYILIDSQVIEKALTWLSGLQAADGSFPERGRVLHTAMQGGAANGVALTAYTLITFLENKDRLVQFERTINKAIAYILDLATNSDDIYSLALATYALQLTKHSSRSTIYAKFQLLAKQEGDRKWWTRPTPQISTSQSVWYIKPSSVDVEMTAYGLLSILIVGSSSDALPVVRWLLSKRNDQGGYQSTQDTVVAMTALAGFGKLISNKASNVEILIKHLGQETKTSVTASNALVLQQFPLSSLVRTVDIIANGQGFALVQVAHRYNLNFNEPSPRFNVKPIIAEKSTVEHLLLTVCTSYIPLNNQKVSSMAVMEVELPSGYTADIDQFSDIKTKKNVKRVEMKNGGTVVVIYFDNIAEDEICLLIGAYRQHKVANQKPVPVKVYDYYENSQSGCTFYSVPELSICDICDGNNCGNDCKK